MIDSRHAEGVGCRSCPATIEVGGLCLDQGIMAQKDAKGGKVPPLLVHMSMHDARFWCATGCTARAAVAADSEVGIAWEGNCRVQEPHPPALWASTFRSRGSLPGKSWFPGERAAAEMHAAVHLAKRWAARMTWGWSTGCEWNLTTFWRGGR